MELPGAFAALLAERGLASDRVSPRDAFAAVLDLYAGRRVRGCALDADGDMLLFQWGREGEDGPGWLDLTRQIMWSSAPDEDDEIWQLSCRFAFPDAGSAFAPPGNHWCASPAALPAFREFLGSSAALAAVAARSGAAELVFEPVE